MGYRDLASCVADLERNGALVRINEEVSSDLEIGVIQRRVYQAGGPALLFTRVKGSSFPMLGNLFGTLERTRYIFRDTLKAVERLVRLKIDPRSALREPASLFAAIPAAYHLLPKFVSDGPILGRRTTIDQLPQLKSWPGDGGAFITLPQVYSESAYHPGLRHSNLGMYRVQISG
ncbi:UbiD family decarboxylase, partial [Geomonas sp.]|uniref:UbiD family decarboxylase n=1 Tax=Geomonas sp. TaxID=2651584 RepID=UPI002B476856